MDSEKQMKMAFMNEGGVPDNTVGVDPVSGNDIPVGSTAKEVRDDIPAMLSEGEYVVPADVVKYHGVAKFEKLREQAKKGLQDMDEDGRIGGEPVDGPDIDSEELDEEEEMLLQEILGMQGEEEVVTAAAGTFVPTQGAQVQMPASGPTPPSTQQPQGTTTTQQPNAVYGITTASGAPVTASTPLVNKQPVVSDPVADPAKVTKPVADPTEAGMVTKRYIAPDCRRIEVLTLNGQNISATPADFDQFVLETEESIKRFGCGIEDLEEVADTITTSLTSSDDGEGEGGEQVTDLVTEPKFDTSTPEGSMAAADYYTEKSGVNVSDPLKAAQDALSGVADSDFVSGMTTLAGALLGPVGTIGGALFNTGSQADALSTAYANLSMAEYLGDTSTANSIQEEINNFLDKAPKATQFLDDLMELGSKKMGYALQAARSVDAPDSMALTEDRFKTEEAFTQAMNDVAAAGYRYDPDQGATVQTDETVDIPVEGGGGSVAVRAGSQAATASSVKQDETGTVFTPGATTVRPVARPTTPSSSSTGGDDRGGDTSNIGNYGGDRDGDGVPNALDFDDGVGWADTNKSDSDSGGDSGGGGGGGGCCFIMLEARYGDGTMDEVVRRYRDEYMTDRNRRGYYKTAEVLVPLMRKSKAVKWVVTKTFADPLVSYGKYYYGENKHGFIFSPVKNFWMKVFDVVGGETQFVRENGEVV